MSTTDNDRRIYSPDRWVVIKLQDGPSVLYKVFGSWSGGYLDGDSWRLNSGITKVEKESNCFKFHGYTGSVYVCHENSYGTTGYAAATLASWPLYKSGEAKVMPEDTDWLDLV